MSKVITSPVKRWPGTVTLFDPFPFPVYNAWMDAIGAAQKIREGLTILDTAVEPQLTGAIIPGIIACVESWNLSGLGNVTAATFPATPRQASIRLVAWLISEIVLIINAEDADPKN
jgi:hypothetical protein